MFMSAANKLTGQIINHLHTNGHYAWRASSVGIPSPTGLRAAPKKGVSDIVGCLSPNGRITTIEVKIGKDKLRPEQTGFLKNIEHVGGLTYVAKNYDDYLAWYDTIT